MDARERLRNAISQREQQLRATVPVDRVAASIAVIEAIDRRLDTPTALSDVTADLITGRHFSCYGGSKAIQFCLEAEGDREALASGSASTELLAWVNRFLADCDHLAAAETVLGHVETGFMRIADDGVRAGAETLAAWRSSRLTPASWRERADIDWWASWLANAADTNPSKPQKPQTSRPPAGSDAEAEGDPVAADPLRAMAYQNGYPREAVVDGCSMQVYGDVLRELISRLHIDSNLPNAISMWSEPDLVGSIAETLHADSTMVRSAVSAFVVDRESAAWHASVPGVALAPLVRVAPGRIVGSRLGLQTEPLFFLGRELRRRAPADYHNSARFREQVFKQDLYRLFNDRRFVTSTDRIELRREKGSIRTDIDAVVFDRKTGTLGLFELKSQDPFSRSAEEMSRRRDNVLYANGQIGSILDWINRHGADEVLRRVDARTAKTFRVQRVYPFVLARYLVRFDDGPTADRRAAWGTWPEVLRASADALRRAAEANPIASLFTSLRSEPLPGPMPHSKPRQEVLIGDVRLLVYPSRDAWRAAPRADDRGPAS